MKKILIPVLLVCILSANKAFSQFGVGTLLPNIQTNGGNVGIGIAAPATPLDILNTNTQLRLRYNTSVFSDIQTNSSGYFLVNPPAGGRIGLGITAPLTGFHSNMGVFRVTDPAVANRGFQISPNYTTPNGEIPAGTTVLGVLSTAGEGISYVSSGGGTAGVKIGAYAFNAVQWSSMWETENVNTGFPNLKLTKTAGNVGIGTGANTIASHLDVGNAILGTNAGNLVEWERLYGSSTGNQDNLRIFHRRHTAGINWTTSEIRIQKTVDASDMHFISFRGEAGFSSSLVFGFGSQDMMAMSHTGRVSIGTLKQLSGPHTDSKLSVDGKLVAKSIYVTLLGWADYVFDKNYKLPNLSEVEKFYKENKHLPEIPSEKEVAENGIDVGEMNKLLLKKVEELTLYVVEQQKVSERQQIEIEKLKEKTK